MVPSRARSRAGHRLANRGTGDETAPHLPFNLLDTLHRTQPQANLGLQVTLTTLASRRVAVVLGAFSLASLVLTAIHPWTRTLHWRVVFVVEQGQLPWENNAAVWFSSLTFLVAGLTAILCFIVDQRVREANAEPPNGPRILRVGWIAVAIVFTLLSWDEVGSLHERVDELPLAPKLLVSVPGIGAWAGALIIPIVLVAVALIGFALAQLRRVPWALVLEVLGSPAGAVGNAAARHA